MTRRPFPLVAALVLALAAATAAWWSLADDTRRPSRPVVVGLYQNEPKIHLDADGRPAGLFVELLEEIAERERWTLRYVPCDWPHCLRLLETGRIDLMPDVAYSRDRDRRLDFHRVPATYSWSQAYTRRGVPVYSVEDFAGRRVAILRRAIQQHYLENLARGTGLSYTPVLVDSYHEAFAAARDGRADLVVTNRFAGRRMAPQYGLIETPAMFNPVLLFYATAQDRNGDLLARIDAHLAQWREDPGSIYFQVMRETLTPPLLTVVPRWLLLTVAVAVASSLVLLAFGLQSYRRMRRARAALLDSGRRLRQVLESSRVVLFALRRDGDDYRCEWVSANVAHLFGYTPAQVTAPGWWKSHVHPDDLDAALARVAALEHVPDVEHEFRFIDATGRVRAIYEELRVARSAGGRPVEVTGTWNDVTEARSHADEIRFLADHDALTGLPNRARLKQCLGEAIEHARIQGGTVTVLALDLDRFHAVNDSLGHAAGDRLLREAAARLGAFAGARDVLARVGSDEFVLVAADPDTDAETLARRILDRFALPLSNADLSVTVTTSIGIARYPHDGVDADTLVRHAELALHGAKRHGRNRCLAFASELSAVASDRIALENALRVALERGEMSLHYQPQFALDDGRLVGVEALARWQHPEWGAVPPDRFIPVAEDVGLIDSIGTWALRTACAQLRAWDGEGLHVPSVAVNLSMKQIEPGVLPTLVAGVLAETGLEPARLELEITESSVMRDPDRTIATLVELKALGLVISIDDFGTGHSSLAHLQRLPVDRLKIDRDFVRGIGLDRGAESICRTVLQLAHNLHLDVVAEGVEHDRQAAFLREHGCTFAQGYLYCRPVPAGELRGCIAKG